MAENQKKPLALITGAGRRIGREIALDLAKCGWAIGVHYNTSRDEALGVVDEITSFGSDAFALTADLSKYEDVEKLIPQCLDLSGPPTCLINNASLFESDRLRDLTEKSWNLHMDINLKAPMFLSQAFAKHLPSSGRGNIINIIDQKVNNLTPYFFSYTISKSALWTATQTMAQDLAPNIRVNAIAPGPVLQSIHQTPEQFEKQCQSTPLKKGTSPQEIAQAVRFILQSDAMTGQLITLDGGQHLAWKRHSNESIES